MRELRAVFSRPIDIRNNDLPIAQNRNGVEALAVSEEQQDASAPQEAYQDLIRVLTVGWDLR